MPEQMEHGWVRRTGAKLYYEACGSGPPLLLLHGNGEDASYFDRQIETFAASFRVIAMDCRGHGKSSFGKEPLSFAVMAEDVVALLDALGIPAAHILGFSDGGNTALTLALKHPQRLRSMILVGANLCPGGVKRSAQIPVLVGYGICLALALFSEAAREKKQILGLMVHEPNIQPEQLAAVTIPTLVMAGERDMILPAHTQLIHRAIQGSKLVIVPGAGHFIADRLPDEFNRIVLQFLRRLKDGGGKP